MPQHPTGPPFLEDLSYWLQIVYAQFVSSEVETRRATVPRLRSARTEPDLSV